MDARRSAWMAAGAAMAALATSGCVVAAGTAAGYGAWEYADGEYIGVAGATLDRTWRATLQALESMGLTIKSKLREGMRADFRAVQPDGTAVEIVLTRQSADFTRITVRVGVFGDEAASKRIVATIKGAPVRAAWGAAAAGLLTIPGCAPTVIATAGFGALQAGTSAFIHGELESAQVLAIEDVRGAVLLALEAMQFELISQLHD